MEDVQWEMWNRKNKKDKEVREYEIGNRRNKMNKEIGNGKKGIEEIKWKIGNMED